MSCSQISDYTAIGVLEAKDTGNFHWAKNGAVLLIWCQLKIELTALREQRYLLWLIKFKKSSEEAVTTDRFPGFLSKTRESWW